MISTRPTEFSNWQVIRRFMHKRLMEQPANLFTVEEIVRLSKAPSCYSAQAGGNAYTDEDQKFFVDLLDKIEPERNPFCTINHDGVCNIACSY